MKKEIKSTLTMIGVSFLVLLSNSVFAEEEKFNLGGNEPVDRGPLFILATVGFIALFGVMLYLKIKHDRKKTAEIQEQIKTQAKQPHVSRGRSHSRSSDSRQRGATS